tara:strand:+ start:354 stop:842 length:489 start_codon:yes stop_codon:yes gene_type:complete
MSILTYINKVPLYTSIDEAVRWAKHNNILNATGLNYHPHKYMSVTGYMGGKLHGATPLRLKDLPVKTKSKPGYRPKIGSRIISTIAGKSTITKVTANTVYDIKGFPIARDENEFEVLPRVVNELAQPQLRPNLLNTSTPVAVNVPVVTSTPVGGGGGGGGGY